MGGLIKYMIDEFIKDNKDEIVKLLKENLTLEMQCEDKTGKITVGLYFAGEYITSCYSYLNYTASDVQDAVDEIKYRTRWDQWDLA